MFSAPAMTGGGIAQRLAATLRPSIVAALERTAEADIEALLGDAGVAPLGRHYGEVQALPAAAQALAMAEAEKRRSRIQATGNALRRRIIHEMERTGTLDQREVELRAFAKAAHNEPERAMRAAAELERRRTSARDVESQAAGPA